MIIGIPKEIKEDEYRVAIVPAGVRALVLAGHKVLIEDQAGSGSGIANFEYENEGAEILSGKNEIFFQADMIIKVKEPLASEYDLFREGQILYTFLHLAAAPELTRVLLERMVIAIAYETVQLKDGSLPLLIPMSEIAGRMSVHEGAKCLKNGKGGRGVLLGGVPGVEPGKVVILGAGVVGMNAAKMAVGAGASVTLLDIDLAKLRYADDIFGGRIKTLMSNGFNVVEVMKDADMVIGAVLIPGALTPRLIARGILSMMKEGSVIVDVGIDQGGCAETSRQTSHSDPTYIVDGIIHYCVANMPGVVARTSTFALTNATFSFALKIANNGYRNALLEDPVGLARGLNLVNGKVTCRAVADALGYEYVPVEEVLE
ncbi:MAG: alanine dehydrogenase [Nitrospinota bacterium]